VADLPPRHHRRWPRLSRLRQWTEASKHHTHKQASRAAKGLGTGVEYSSVISPRLSSNPGSATEDNRTEVRKWDAAISYQGKVIIIIDLGGIVLIGLRLQQPHLLLAVSVLSSLFSN
jgi:hypothetical protein